MEKQRFPRVPRNVLKENVKRLAEGTQTSEIIDQLVISLIETHVSVYAPIVEIRKQLEAAGFEPQRIKRLMAQALRNLADKLVK